MSSSLPTESSFWPSTIWYIIKEINSFKLSLSMAWKNTMDLIAVALLRLRQKENEKQQFCEKTIGKKKTIGKNNLLFCKILKNWYCFTSLRNSGERQDMSGLFSFISDPSWRLKVCEWLAQDDLSRSTSGLLNLEYDRIIPAYLHSNEFWCPLLTTVCFPLVPKSMEGCGVFVLFLPSKSSLA